MTENANARAKTNAYNYDKNKEKKKAKGTKKCVIKNNLTFDDFKNSGLRNETAIRSQIRFRTDHHWVFTEEVNKHLTELLHTHTEHLLLKFVNQKC